MIFVFGNFYQIAQEIFAASDMSSSQGKNRSEASYAAIQYQECI
jgi:hypothetical protein